MNYTDKDKGEFLRGFLILAKKDKKISAHERSMVMVVGNYFGFEKRFCEESINNIFENEYISEKPPLFSNIHIARFFVIECLDIFEQINGINNPQRVWLQETLLVNGINNEINAENKITY